MHEVARHSDSRLVALTSSSDLRGFASGMGLPVFLCAVFRAAVQSRIEGWTDLHLDETQALIRSTRDRISEARSLVAWSLARELAERQRIGNHPSVSESTSLLAVLESPCDLDVLVFFHRHPRAFLNTFDLAQRVGYDTAEIDCSIENLLGAGLVTSSKPRESATARLYEFTPGRWATVLPRFLWVASTADGRRALRRALVTRPRSRVRSALRDD